MKANYPSGILLAAEDVVVAVDRLYYSLQDLRRSVSCYVDSPDFSDSDHDIDLECYLKDVQYSIQDMLAWRDFDLGN